MVDQNKTREIKLSHLAPIWKCLDEEKKGLAERKKQV